MTEAHSSLSENDRSASECLPRSLEDLERLVERDLDVLSYPARPWMKPCRSGQPAFDVVIVGGGQCGIAAAFALMREKIVNLLVLDENPEGQEGPWMTYARMPNLRTAKTLVGPELGIPNLTFRAFYEAQFGALAWNQLEKISRDSWMDYLIWLRRVLKLPLRNSTRVKSIEPGGATIRLVVGCAGRDQVIHARRVVLATGSRGGGGPNIPASIALNLPQERYAHAYAPIPFADLSGKRVGVIGAGATAFDNAATALEHNAADVTLLMRRPAIPPCSVIRWTDWSGFLQNFADLDDAQRWNVMRYVTKNPSPPPLQTVQRLERYSNFKICFSSPVVSSRMTGDVVELSTPGQAHRFDFVILGTGFVIDLSRRPELSGIASAIALWKDRYTPPPNAASEKFERYPYLGRNYEFTEKVPGTAPFVRHIYNFNYSASLSMGPTGRVSGLRYGTRRLVVGIARSFLQEDFDAHFHSLLNYNESELGDHPWTRGARDESRGFRMADSAKPDRNAQEQ